MGPSVVLTNSSCLKRKFCDKFLRSTINCFASSSCSYPEYDRCCQIVRYHKSATKSLDTSWSTHGPIAIGHSVLFPFDKAVQWTHTALLPAVVVVDQWLGCDWTSPSAHSFASPSLKLTHRLHVKCSLAICSSNMNL